MANKNLKTLASFAGHVFTGTALATIVALGCYGLHEVRHFLIGRGVDAVFTDGLHVMEYIGFGLDFLVFVVWCYTAFVEAVKEMLKK